MNQTRRVLTGVVALLAASAANSQQSPEVARKFVADAKAWMNAPGKALMNDPSKPVAFVHFTADALASDVLRELGAVQVFNDRVAERALRRVLSDKNIRSISLVETNLAMMDKMEADRSIKLCDEETFSYCRAFETSGWRSGSGARELTGVLVDGEKEQEGQALLVARGKDVVGQVLTNDSTFTLRSIAPSVLAITTSQLGPQDRDPDDVSRPPPPPAEPNPLNDTGGPAAAGAIDEVAGECSNPAKPVQVDLSVGITRRAAAEALNKQLDVRLLLEFSASLANTSLRLSKINGTLNVADTVDVSYVESGDFETDVNALLRADRRLVPLLSSRTSHHADVTVLIIDDPNAYKCGQAAGIRVDSGRSFAVVNWQCLTDRFSFVHEVGHLIGAWHDPKTLETQLRPGEKVQPAYAHGYITTGLQPVTTIMGYPNACPQPCGRSWYWANPELSYRGQVLGTRDVNFDACVWRKRLPVVAAFDGR